jgi:hypothetical protein
MTAFIFTAKDGKLDFGTPYNEARFHAHLKDNEGKLFRIEKQVKPRTLSQNSFYWLYLGVIERETGNNSNDLHEYFRRTLLTPVFITVMGKEIKIPRSTTSLKKGEFGEYMDKISAQTGVPIPDAKAHKEYLDSAPMIDDK